MRRTVDEPARAGSRAGRGRSASSEESRLLVVSARPPVSSSGRAIAQEKADRWITFGCISVVVHAALAVAKLAMGVVFHSQYFVASAVYAALTSVARGVSVRAFLAGRRTIGVGVRGGGARLQLERRAYRASGIVVSVASVSYLLCGVVMLTLFDGSMEADYGTIGGITAATIAFTEMGLAIWGLASTRGAGEPSLAALKAANLASAFVSLSLAQAALMSFASEIPSRVPDALGCIFMSALSLAVGLFMVAKAKNVGATAGVAPRKRNDMARKKAPERKVYHGEGNAAAGERGRGGRVPGHRDRRGGRV